MGSGVAHLNPAAPRHAGMRPCTAGTECAVAPNSTLSLGRPPLPSAPCPLLFPPKMRLPRCLAQREASLRLLAASFEAHRAAAAARGPHRMPPLPPSCACPAIREALASRRAHRRKRRAYVTHQSACHILSRLPPQPLHLRPRPFEGSRMSRCARACVQPPACEGPPSRPSTPRRRRTRTQPHPTRFVSEHLSFLFRPQGVCRSKAELHGNPDSTAVDRRMAAGCRHSLPQSLTRPALLPPPLPERIAAGDDATRRHVRGTLCVERSTFVVRLSVLGACLGFWGWGGGVGG